VLRDRAWWDKVADVIPDPDSRPIIDELTNDVVVMYALNKPDAFEPVSLVWAAARDLSREEVVAESRESLARVAAASRRFGEAGRYRVEVPSDPDLAASLVLNVRDWLAADAVDGTPVMAIGTRVLLHVCGDGDVAGVNGLAELSRVLFDEADGLPLTSALLTLEPDGGVVPLA
jgi:hypothetical protein